MKKCLRPQPEVKTYILQYIYKTGNGYALVNAHSPNQAESIFLTLTRYRNKYQNLKVISIEESRWLGQKVQLVEEGSVNTSGKNAYDLAVLNGFRGTYDEFMASLKGDPGRDIVSIIRTNRQGLVDTYTITYSSGEPQYFQITNGEKGEKGDKGDKGDKGEDGEFDGRPIYNNEIDNIWSSVII